MGLYVEDTLDMKQFGNVAYQMYYILRRCRVDSEKSVPIQFAVRQRCLSVFWSEKNVHRTLISSIDHHQGKNDEREICGRYFAGGVRRRRTLNQPFRASSRVEWHLRKDQSKFCNYNSKTFVYKILKID